MVGILVQEMITKNFQIIKIPLIECSYPLAYLGNNKINKMFKIETTNNFRDKKMGIIYKG